MPDTWTSLQFDAAISLFGVWIDNRLEEMDYTDPKHPRHKYTLEGLLDEKPSVSMFEGLKGLPGIRLNLK